MSVELSTNDLFMLIPKKHWTEEEKIDFMISFNRAYGAYIISEINQELPEDIDQKLTELLDSKPTLAEIEAFYNELFPNLEDKFFTKALEFKKDFLLALYKNKLRAASRLHEKVFWEGLVANAQQDNWDEVQRMISADKEIA